MERRAYMVNVMCVMNVSCEMRKCPCFFFLFALAGPDVRASDYDDVTEATTPACAAI